MLPRKKRKEQGTLSQLTTGKKVEVACTHALFGTLSFSPGGIFDDNNRHWKTWYYFGTLACYLRGK